MTEKAKDTAGTATGSAQGATPPLAQPVKTRNRLSIKTEKKLAYALKGLVAILASKAVVAVLTEEQKAKAAKAGVQAKESIGTDDPLKATTDRIVAIQGELKAIDYAKDPEKAVSQALELGKELDKQIKRKKQIEEVIAG